MLLAPEARDKAAYLFRALTTTANKAQARAMLDEQGIMVEYVEEHWGRRLAAGRIDGVRLIDNVSIVEVTHSRH
jgi:pantoate--beta-alanine ligase